MTTELLDKSDEFVFAPFARKGINPESRSDLRCGDGLLLGPDNPLRITIGEPSREVGVFGSTC
jgi:hypothetical protein